MVYFAKTWGNHILETTSYVLPKDYHLAASSSARHHNRSISRYPEDLYSQTITELIIDFFTQQVNLIEVKDDFEFFHDAFHSFHLT
jgi:hypothetical protein